MRKPKPQECENFSLPSPPVHACARRGLEAFTGLLLSAAAYIAGFLGISAVFSGLLVLSALVSKKGAGLIKK